MHCNTIRYDYIQFHTIQYDYNTLGYKMIKYDTVTTQYNTRLQNNTIRDETIR